MLTPEQAKARIAEWELPEKPNRIAAGIAKLPAALKKIAPVVLGMRGGDGSLPEESSAEIKKRHDDAVAEIDRLTAKQRAKIFEIVAPALVPAVEGAWQLLKTTPYQFGYDRMAFRVPHHPQLQAEKLADWLRGLTSLARRFSPGLLTPDWLAAWAPHLAQGYSSWDSEIGILLAAVLNERSSQADEVFDILRQPLNNQHEIGGAGRHVYKALLLANRREGWELVEKTLLAAQRQEGLRQAILETIDETHPEAFRRMLRLILEQDLIRFSSVVRAVDVWFGQLWAAAGGSVVKKMLAQVVEFLDDPRARDKALSNKALAGKNAETAFLALWCAATEDAVASIELASKLLASKSVDVRYVAARHLRNLNLNVAAAALVPTLADEDLRVALVSIPAHSYESMAALPASVKDDRFEHLERLLARVPEKPQKLKPLVWPWTAREARRSQVAACLLPTLGKRPITRLTPYLSQLDPNGRGVALEHMVQTKPWDTATGQAVVDLAGNASADVRAAALKALADAKLTAAHASQLEGYLNRKTGDLRAGVLSLLLKLPDAAALASAGGLLATKDANQRLAGLELLRLMNDGSRSVAECRRLATSYRTKSKTLTKQEQSHLHEIAQDKVAVATLDDALGLMNPAERTPVVPPRNLKIPLVTPAAVACLKALDDLVHKHRETSITIKSFSGPEEQLLGNVSYGFPSPDCGKPAAGQEANLPLAEVWQQWLAGRGRALKDADGLEFVRALAWYTVCDDWNSNQWTEWAEDSPAREKATKTISGGQPALKLRYNAVGKLVEWFVFLFPTDATDFLLDALEASYALVPAEDMKQLGVPREENSARGYYRLTDDEADWRDAKPFEIWDDALGRYLYASRRKLTPEQAVRRWRLEHWRDEPFAGARRRRVNSDLLLAAYAHQAASLADIADHLLAPRGWDTYSKEGFDLLSEFTSRNRSPSIKAWLAKHPEMQELVDKAVERILELELNRGDAPTAATLPAHAIHALWGIETLRRILHALGKAEFKLGARWRQTGMQDRRQALTRLAQVTFLKEGETPQDFAKVMQAAVKAGQFPEERLLQLAFLSPQWTKCLETYLGWNQMSEGVYWFLAHMQHMWGLTDNAAVAEGEVDDADSTDDSAEESTDDDSAAGPAKKLSAWERLILERTPLTDAERNEGAIDVAWFRRTHEQLGPKRWQTLASAARFAANASQAKRAQFIADVLLDNVSRNELITGIQKKQLKEHVRLLGLLPLATGKKRQPDLIERCRVLRDYRRYANQLSGLTKPAALLAWEIGMKNLAQTAGYADPLRLEWAVGAESVKDLAAGPLTVTARGVSVTLALDELSKPTLTVRKQDKELKSIPPAIKKDKQIAELAGRVTDLNRQAAAIRRTLESSMCRGDTFSGDELRAWCGHALVAPLLSRLVVSGEGIQGYPDKQGKSLRDHRGKLEPVKPGETLRIAHPHDLLQSNDWQAWQAECFQSERVQPFKQIFRELYVITKQEKKDGGISRRYDGQQVQPKQALALFGNRGWNTNDGVFKVFHDAGLTASVDFQSGVTTPLEVEGATLAGVTFTRRDEWKPTSLASVPPRLFSEVMRDVDLVVSVAHAGQVDPEASASTVEMRAALLRETCGLLNLKNVRLKPAHVVIDGQLAQYSVHLSSGTVHRLPGGSLCIVPVHAQHRGRLFLPFADDDPRTAEIISKVLLLARDQEIQDPIILEQIRR